LPPAKKIPLKYYLMFLQVGGREKAERFEERRKGEGGAG